MVTPDKITDSPEPQSGRAGVWMRGLYMLILIVAVSVAQSVLDLTALVQFLWLLLAGKPNPLLARFGQSLGRWLSQTAGFLSCTTEEKPFPWREWPSAEDSGASSP